MHGWKTCIANDGVLWVADARTLLGVDARGTIVARIETSLPETEQIAAFVPLADGFLLAAEGARGQRAPRGRVLRISRAGAERWARELLPGPVSLVDPHEVHVDSAGTRTRHAWQASTWECVHHVPLAVADDAVLCGFHEWPRSGLGRRHVLGLNRGQIAWTSPVAPSGHAAIAGPGVFLTGAQGYGAFSSSLVGRLGPLQSWPTHGHYLVTGDCVRVVEMSNDSSVPMHTATLRADGTLARGERLPGYHTSGPVALADGSIFMWRGGALLRVDAAGSIVERQEFGDREAAAGRIVTDDRGRFACVLSDDAYGRGDWPLWIFDTVLPALAPGPWPCEGGGPRNHPVLLASS